MFKNDYEFSEEDYKEPYNDINGTIYSSFFIGKKDLLLNLHNYFYNEILINYVKYNKFIGIDTYISLYLSYPELFELNNGENDEYTIQFSQLKWFYFLKYFS